jgi:serine/threonine-protein kinase RCK2
MRQLRHENVVQLIDFVELPDYYFIILELLPGGELFHQIVRLTYFSEELSRHVILQVAHAVRYLHETAGVVHRDIKPENLLFYPCDFVPSKVKIVRKGEDESKEDEGEFVAGVGSGGIGVIKLADFGLSKVIWDSKTMTPCGTVGYTAPEIVKDERYSKSVDMWALGCVLYTILCGFPPFYDESIEILTEKVAKGQYTFLSPWWDEISVSAKDLVSHLLTVDPEKRYTIDEFLNHPWITQTAVSAPPQVKIKTSPIVSETLENAEGRREKELASSVAATTLKEVFDVSNAVHRMEEEKARRRYGMPAAFLNSDNIVEEEEENEEDRNYQENASTISIIPTPAYTTTKARTDDVMEGVQKSMERVSVGGPSTPLINTATTRTTRRRAKGPGAGGAGGFFDLHLEGATLLERRKRGNNPVPAPVPSLIT